MRPRGLSLSLAVVVALAAPAKGRRASPPDDREAAPPEEIVILGVRTGELEPVPAANTDLLFTDDFTGEQKDLADLLSETEGVYVRRFGAAGDRSEVSIRGSSPSQVAVTLDGVRTNSALTGGLDLSRLCLPLLERVEVVRGAGTLQEGSGAIGGVVNLVTRAAEASETTRISGSVGAFETYEGSALHSGWLGDLDYTLGYCGFHTEGDFEFARPTEKIDGVEIKFAPATTTRVNNDRIQHAGTLALGYPIAGGVLRFSDYGVYSEGGEPGTDSEDGPIAGQATEARSYDTSNLAQLRWEGLSPSGGGGDLAVALYHRVESARFRDPAVPSTLEPIDVRTNLQTTGARLADTWRTTPGGQRSDLALQLDFAQDLLHANDRPSRQRARGGLALDETLRLLDEKILLTGGARVDWTESFDPEILPAAGLVLSPFSWLRLRGQAGRAYRAPSFDELYHPDEIFLRGNPDLEPEDAWNFDAGVELQLAQAGPFSDVQLRAGWFRREIDESIAWVRINPQTVAPRNTGSATAQGYELAASLRLTRYLHLSGNHTESDSRRDDNRARLPGQPRRESFGRLQLGPEGAWKLVGEVHHVGEILVSVGGLSRLPARTVWNARAALNLAALPWPSLDTWISELWVFAAVENIEDVAVRDAISFPQPGRHATAGVEGRW